MIEHNHMKMQSKKSAGLLMLRIRAQQVEVFLVQPGGPFRAKKNEEVWTLPKGEFGDDEEPFSAAQREFREETGFTPTGPYLELGSVRKKSGKVVFVCAFASQQILSALREVAAFDIPLAKNQRCVETQWRSATGSRTRSPTQQR